MIRNTFLIATIVLILGCNPSKKAATVNNVKAGKASDWISLFDGKSLNVGKLVKMPGHSLLKMV